MSLRGACCGGWTGRTRWLAGRAERTTLTRLSSPVGGDMAAGTPPALCSTPRGERASKCRDALRPDAICRPRCARRVKGAARFLARRERSHAQKIGVCRFSSMASTCPFDPPCAPWHPALHRSDRVVRRLLVVCRVSSRCQGTDRAIDRASPDRSHTVATLKAATRTPVWGRSPAISQHAICRSAPSVLARARGSTFRPTHRALSSNPHSDYSTPHCCTERFARQALSHSSSEHAMSFRIYTTSRAIGTQSVGQFC